jgi:hypothetical protein
MQGTLIKSAVVSTCMQGSDASQCKSRTAYGAVVSTCMQGSDESQCKSRTA